ncbi:MAG: sulfate transporter, inner rane subunit, partial [Thermoleophilia bacterium]|nr:sulfate transporter, inner rane subunit [Thermoleophilia bacterium]
MTRYLLRAFVVLYVGALILAPLGMVFSRALSEGLDALWLAVSSETALHALELTVIATVVATVVNTIFGIACALLLVRRRPRGAAFISALIDLPFAVSPIVVGLALLLTFGVNGWFGSSLVDAGFPVIYALPGIVLA